MFDCVELITVNGDEGWGVDVAWRLLKQDFCAQHWCSDIYIYNHNGNDLI